jgi:hypothetical protein
MQSEVYFDDAWEDCPRYHIESNLKRIMAKELLHHPLTCFEPKLVVRDLFVKKHIIHYLFHGFICILYFYIVYNYN